MRPLISVSLMVLIAANCVAAELTVRERRMIDTVNASVRKAGKSYQSGDYPAAAQNIRRAMNQIEIATKAGSAALYDAMLPSMKRVATARAMLELEGVSLPPFRRPERPSDTPAIESSMEANRPAEDQSKAPATPSPTPATAISFTKQVAPILNNRCGRCHVATNKGQFSMASYAALMKGPPEGVVIFAGDTVGSRLIETIKTGDMPRGGGKVSPEELKTLEQWILSGAKFDGENPNSPLGATGAPAPPNQAKKPTVRMATGKETVSLAADVAPLLVANCKGCHIDAMQTQGGLRMDTLAQMMRGGDSGEIVLPGRGAESLLVKKLRGMGDGERMPAGGRPALSDQAIQLIATWIDEGATLDGKSADQPLSVMSALAWAARASDQQMSERRETLARESMALVAQPSTHSVEKTDHFTVIGTGSMASIRMVAQAAEDQMKTVQSIVRGATGEAYFHGRATIFVLPRRYDYSEFAKMVEGRSVPSQWDSHWMFDGVDAYVSIVATDADSDEQLENRLIAPLVSLAVSTRGGDVPRWFAEGAGATMASRMAGDSDRTSRDRTRSETYEAIAAMENAKRFLDRKLTPAQSDRIAAAVVASTMDPARRKSFDKVLRFLAEGKAFDRAFSDAFGVPVASYIDSWLRYARGS